MGGTGVAIINLSLKSVFSQFPDHFPVAYGVVGAVFSQLCCYKDRLGRFALSALLGRVFQWTLDDFEATCPRLESIAMNLCGLARANES